MLWSLSGLLSISHNCNKMLIKTDYFHLLCFELSDHMNPKLRVLHVLIYYFIIYTVDFFFDQSSYKLNLRFMDGPDLMKTENQNISMKISVSGILQPQFLYVCHSYPNHMHCNLFSRQYYRQFPVMVSAERI
jgi:hypothetical protein